MSCEMKRVRAVDDAHQPHTGYWTHATRSNDMYIYAPIVYLYMWPSTSVLNASIYMLLCDVKILRSALMIAVALKLPPLNTHLTPHNAFHHDV